jgi:hypothetical protein
LQYVLGALVSFFGLKFLGNQIGALRMNSIYWDTAEGRDKDFGTDSPDIAYALKIIEDKMDKFSSKTSKLLSMQLFCSTQGWSCLSFGAF